MNYYERHIGDYLKDTAHLSLLEHGVYTRLMDVYYTREGAIPASEVARLVGARSKDEREALQAVLAEFFTLADGLHSQDRCDREIARFKDKQAKAKRSADARWSKPETHTEGNANASPDAMRTHSEGNAPRARPQSPDTSNQEHPPTPKGAPADPAGFAEFWASWPSTPRKVDRKKCAEKWRRGGFGEQLPGILAHVSALKQSRQWRDGYEPAPLTYLNGERWRDGTPTEAGADTGDIFAGAQ